MSDDDVSVLVCAKEKLAAGWCQYALARDAEGEALDGTELGDAFQVCLVGALIFTAGLGTTAYARAHDLVTRAADTRDAAIWNDMPGRTQAEVLDVLDAAIRLAKDSPSGRRPRRRARRQFKGASSQGR